MNYWFELRYTLRLMRKRLGFTALSVFVIALGIGISIPLISMTKFFGLGSLPGEGADRLVVLKQFVPGEQNLPLFDPFVLRRIEQGVDSYAKIGAFQQAPAIFSDGESAEAFTSARIMPRIFDLLPAAPLLGRPLQDSDDAPGAPPVAVIGFDLWQNYYSGAEDIIGQTSRINGEPVTIVGVMPEGFAYPIRHELWLPLQLDGVPEPGQRRSLYVVGQLSEGVGRDAASVEFNALMLGLAEEFPQSYSGVTGTVMSYPLITMNDGPIFGQLALGIVVTLLLLVCFNVANLLTARNTERVSELAVRGALGGTLWRIMRQVLLESLLICIFAATIGLLIGSLALAALASSMQSFPGGSPFWVVMGLQSYELIAVLAITLSIWLVSGLFPAWQVARQDISQVLAADSGPSGKASAGRATQFLVTVEIVASCFLLIVCMAFVIGLYSASRMDMGIDSEGYLSARLDLSAGAYQDPANKLRFLDALQAEVGDMEQFERPAYATALAGQQPPRLTYALEDRDVRQDGRYPQVGLVWASENYAEAMDISLLAGRYFDFSDNDSSQPTVVVDELFAARFWPDQPLSAALGQRIQLAPGQPGQWLRIVGVVNHLIQGQPTAERLYQSTVYRPLAQLPASDPAIRARVNSVALAVAATGLADTELSEFETQLKNAVSRVDRDVPLSSVMTLDRAKYLVMEAVNTTADIMLWVSLVTLVLAVVGIYGVVSRSVLSRGKEVGIRRALGSTNFNIVRIFMAQGSRFLSLGVLIGGMGGILVVDGIFGATGSQGSSMGFTLSLTIPIVACLGALVLLASYVPARKLVASEPGEALHYE